MVYFLVQTSPMRRNIIFASAVIVVLVVSLVAGFIISYQPTKLDVNDSIDQPAKLDVNVSMDHTSVLQGNNLQADVNVSITGNPQNVTLSADVGSSGIQCNFEPSTGKSNFTSLLTINVPDSTPSGNYTVTMTASGGSLTQNSYYIISVISATNITVTGRVTLLSGASWAILNSIQFEDTQTKATFKYTFPFLVYDNTVPRYSVTLQNQCTYKVTITFTKAIGHTLSLHAFSESNLYVYAPAGNTTISDQNYTASDNFSG